MSESITAHIPHDLGREEAKRRIADGMGRVADFVPGGVITDNRWDDHVAHFDIEALGQRLACRLDVLDDDVVATFELPGVLGPFAGVIRRKLEQHGPKLLQ